MLMHDNENLFVFMYVSLLPKSIFKSILVPVIIIKKTTIQQLYKA